MFGASLLQTEQSPLLRVSSNFFDVFCLLYIYDHICVLCCSMLFLFSRWFLSFLLLHWDILQAKDHDSYRTVGRESRVGGVGSHLPSRR